MDKDKQQKLNQKKSDERFNSVTEKAGQEKKNLIGLLLNHSKCRKSAK